MLTEQMNSEWFAEEGKHEDDWLVWVRIGNMKGVIVDHIPQGTAEHIRDTHNAWLGSSHLIDRARAEGAESLLLDVRDDSVEQIALLKKIVQARLASAIDGNAWGLMVEMIDKEAIPYLQSKDVPLNDKIDANRPITVMAGMQVYDYNRADIAAFKPRTVLDAVMYKSILEDLAQRRVPLRLYIYEEKFFK